jgi:hypothetical protein
VKRLGKIVVCLASGLVLNAGARAANVVLPDNPYAPISAHNIFHLNPPPAAGAATDATPPPKITPTGIMTIFGTRQVLFTVDGVSKPGQPGKPESYILSEGQRQDDVEVTRIDEKAGVVTFNNHGTVQEIPLVKAPEVSTTTPAQGRLVPMPNVPSPKGDNSGRGSFGGGPDAARNRGGGNDSTLTPVQTGAGYSAGRQQLQNTMTPMTPEVQMLMIAAQHAKAQQEGDPVAAIYPPTPIDAEAGVVPPPSP